MINELAQLWQGPLPPEHLWVIPANRPNRMPLAIRLYLRKWFIHPIKRRVAKYYLILLRYFFDLKVVAITGSVGKTTTKELLAGILALVGPTVYSYANIDPVYNIPSTILKCTPQTRFIILEMGIEFIGEMDYYIWLANPDIAIITCVNRAHSLYLKNNQTIAHEKGRITARQTPAQYLIVNGEDPGITVQSLAKTIEADSKPRYSLSLIGDQYNLNANLAAKAAKILGANDSQINKGIASVQPQPHRLQPVIKNDIYILDDSYNSSPLSAKAAIDTAIKLAKQSKRQLVIIFGQMNELGKYERSSHQEIGEYIYRQKIRHLLCLGPATKHLVRSATVGKCFTNKQDLTEAVKPYLNSKYLLLFKSSRSWHLEDVISSLIR